jgi:hypothetical protein
VTAEGSADRRAASLEIRLGILTDEELRALRGALLAARATELGEVQRRAGRHNLGYGTDSQRESMTAEVADRRRRWEMLDRLLSAIDEATRGTSAEGGAPSE